MHYSMSNRRKRVVSQDVEDSSDIYSPRKPHRSSNSLPGADDVVKLSTANQSKPWKHLLLASIIHKDHHTVKSSADQAESTAAIADEASGESTIPRLNVVLPKVAAFDMDGTLIKPKSGKTFPINAQDWKFLPQVPETLRKLYEDGYDIVIFTNQLHADKNGRLDELKEKLDAIVDALNIPVSIYASIRNDLCRKPGRGMFDLMLDRYYELIIDAHRDENGEIIHEFFPHITHAIDMDQSFYVGDAAGRKGDHSDVDYTFALNIGMKFYVPEQIFTKQTVDPSGFTIQSTNPFQLYLKPSHHVIPPATVLKAKDIVLQPHELAAAKPLLHSVHNLYQNLVKWDADHVADAADAAPTKSKTLNSNDKKNTESPKKSSNKDGPIPSPDNIHPLTKQHCVLIVGPPASGKTTFCKTFKNFCESIDPRGEGPRWTWVNQDTLRTAEKCLAEVQRVLKQGGSVIIDNTNPAADKRKKYIDAASKLKIPIHCVYFPMEKDHSFHLSMVRACYTLGQKTKLPSVAIHSFFKKLEEPTPKEGFTSISTLPFQFFSTAPYTEQSPKEPPFPGLRNPDEQYHRFKLMPCPEYKSKEVWSELGVVSRSRTLDDFFFQFYGKK